MKFFNTMSRRLEEFFPITPGEARLYTCGPTVYNFAHIGNFRAYMFEDLLRRALKFHGFKVVQVMNLTDVDDKTIRDSRAVGIALRDYTKRYKDAFFEDLGTLRIERAEHYPAATEHIPEMIDIIKTLFDKGFAYEGDDGSIYFSIAKFPAYGKLARIDMENQRSGVRVKTDEYAKDAVADFALWKAWDEGDGDVSWESPWGRGRPGWHIECSAMSMKYLGKTFDIHTGGVDNMFPHHEDEIAQSEAANGERFVNYWLHCEHLLVDGQKMSKSLGNFFTLRDLASKGLDPAGIRWCLLSTHYRKKLNFTLDACAQSCQRIKAFTAFFSRLAEASSTSEDVAAVDSSVSKAASAFSAGLADDLNISEALAAVYGLERDANRLMASNSLGAEGSAKILDAFKRFDGVLGVFDFQHIKGSQIPPEITDLAQKRQEARRAKDFKTADTCRDQLKAAGWIVEDTSKGPVLKKIV